MTALDPAWARRLAVHKLTRSPAVKYMLMMHAPRAGWKDAGIGTWPTDDIKAHIAFMMRFNKELTEAGELVGAQGLDGPEEARIVRADKSWRARGHRRAVSGGQGVPRRLLDRRLRQQGPRVRDRGARVGGAGQGRRADEHARSRCAR